MHIDDPNFNHRRILNNINTKQYSPKKRWDQNSFGAERRLLIDHVENALKDHQQDSQILQKFRKQAEQLKIKKRKQKFPHLFENHSQIIKTQINNKLKNEEMHRNISESQFKFYPQTIKEEISSRQERPAPKFLSSMISPIISTTHDYTFELQARLQYERALAQKDLQLFKRELKIKKQNKQIKQLYGRLKSKQKQDQLDRYVKSQQQMTKINKMLVDMNQQLSSRKLQIQNKKVQPILLQSRNQIDSKRNKSQIYLPNYSRLLTINQENQEDLLVKSTFTKGQQEKNPSVEYSPILIKNHSSVYQKVPLYNPSKFTYQENKGHLISEHLQQLKNYNKRLQYFTNINKKKLGKYDKGIFS